jgi:hypothetical protein
MHKTLRMKSTLCAKGIFILNLWCCGSQLYSQNPHLFRGYVEDAVSGERLAGVSIYNDSLSIGTVSNHFGFFSLHGPAGPLTLAFSYVGYQTKMVVLSPGADDHLIGLQPSIWLDTIGVRAGPDRSRPGVIQIPVAQLQHAPAVMGERDVLKTLQMLPGIQGGNEGESGLHVRGGSPDQNLILLDGVPMYNVSHVFGFFSAINSDAVKHVDVYKGGFPSRYAGRLSSIVDIVLKDGDRHQWKGDVAAGLLAARFNLEGPLVKEKTTVTLSGRRSFIDLMSNDILRKRIRVGNDESRLDYTFYDFNMKIAHELNAKERLTLSYYQGRDRYDRSDEMHSAVRRSLVETGLGWRNRTAAFRWSRQWTPGLFGSTRISYHDYRYQNDSYSSLSERRGDVVEMGFVDRSYTTGISDMGIQNDFEWSIHEKHTLNWGLGVTNHRYNPGAFHTSLRTGVIDSFSYADIAALEGSLYLEDVVQLKHTISLHYGFHYSTYTTRDVFHSQLQPRVNLRIQLGEGITFSNSLSRMVQYPHLVSNEGVGLPTDLWIPTTERTRPERAWILASGLDGKIRNVDWNAEVYYKVLNDVASFRESSTLLASVDLEDRITQGKGTTYGLELFVHKKRGKFNGWMGYTLSWANRQFAMINRGRVFPYAYDRRHYLTLTSAYHLSDRWRLSANWIFSSGRPVTIVPFSSGGFRSRTHEDWYTSNGLQGYNTYIDRNDFRLSHYHRLDLEIAYTAGKKQRHEISAGAYNAYNRRNPYYINTLSKSRQDNTGHIQQYQELVQYSLFPILPSLSYKYRFTR